MDLKQLKQWNKFRFTKMTAKQKLSIIKFIHTFVWVFMVSTIFLIVYSAISANIGLFTWIAVAIVLLEGIVLAVFKMSCPLTVIARRYSDSKLENFDIYLPNWLAKYNKLIFTTVFIVGLIVVILRSV